MSKMSRDKGQRGEREVCDILGEALGISLARTLDQTRAGGCDILLDHWAIEVKRQETLSTDRWWAQACRQAKDIGKHPILIYRKSRTPWLCRMPYSLEADPTIHYVHCDLETLIKRLQGD